MREDAQDDGIFMMAFSDFRAQYTRIDLSQPFCKGLALALTEARVSPIVLLHYALPIHATTPARGLTLAP